MSFGDEEDYLQPGGGDKKNAREDGEEGQQRMRGAEFDYNAARLTMSERRRMRRK